MEPFVIDSSFALAWCFLDERTPRTDEIQSWLNSTHALAPALWRWEIANGLLVGCRRKRMSREDAIDALQRLDKLPIQCEANSEKIPLQDMFVLAERHSLSAYDAAYLELAHRSGLPLATLDQALASAAGQVGIKVL